MSPEAGCREVSFAAKVKLRRLSLLLTRFILHGPASLIEVLLLRIVFHIISKPIRLVTYQDANLRLLKSDFRTCREHDF